MASKELAKFEVLLQKQDAIKRFRSLYDQCRLLARARNIAVTDGEVMTVCAYLAGREYAGSVATKEACARLGCITGKVFDRVQDTVSNLIQKSITKPVSKAPTIYSLSQKYGFTSDELQAVQVVEMFLKAKLNKELQDERIVCAVFAVMCELMGYKSKRWIQDEMEIYELDPEDVQIGIERVNAVHGDELRTVVRSTQTSGRSSRHKQIPLPKMREAHSVSLKRKASEEAFQKQGPIKRTKLQSNATASTSSLRNSASSDAAHHSPPATELSTLDWISTLEMTDSQPDNTASSRSEGSIVGVGSRDPTESSSGEESGDDATKMDWESLAQRRKNAMAQGRMQDSGTYTGPKPVFADRHFWQTTWT